MKLLLLGCLVFAGVASADFVVRVKTPSGDPIPGVRIVSSGPFSQSRQLTGLDGEWSTVVFIIGGSACANIQPSLVTSVSKPGYTFDKTTFTIPCGSNSGLVEITGTGTPPPAIAAVSGASYSRSLTGNMIVSAFGQSLGSTTKAVLVRPDGFEALGQVLYISPNQVNLILPLTAPGPGLVQLQTDSGLVGEQAVMVSALAPSLFSADGTGQGAAAAGLVRIGPGDFRSDEILTTPIEFRNEDQTILSLFGTGFTSGFGDALQVQASIGDVPVTVLYAGPQPGLNGLARIDLQLPRSLAGRGQQEIRITANGITANPLTVSFR